MDFTLELDGVKVIISEGPYLEYGQPTAQAVEHYTRLIKQLKDLRRYAAEKLLKLYNNNWLDDNIGPMSIESFAARLDKPAIHLDDETGAAVYFGDGGLFAGHWIEIVIDHRVPLDAVLAG